MLSASRAAQVHAEGVLRRNSLEMVSGEPAWLPSRSERKGFPLVSYIVVTDPEFRAVEVNALLGGAPPAAMGAIDKARLVPGRPTAPHRRHASRPGQGTIVTVRLPATMGQR